MTKLRHLDNLGTARFVTFCCYRSGQFLFKARACELIVKHLDLSRRKHHFRLLGYVIMPDHVHLVLVPPNEIKLGVVVGEIKSKMAREYFASTMTSAASPRVFWQKRCYDHNCRTPDTTKEKIVYCHLNPVRRGMVQHPGEYPWSSYNWYEGANGVPLEMDEYEF